MNISRVLNVKSIKLNLMAKSKEEAVEELTDLLVQDGSISNKDDFSEMSGYAKHKALQDSKIILRSRMVNPQE